MQAPDSVSACPHPSICAEGVCPACLPGTGAYQPGLGTLWRPLQHTVRILLSSLTFNLRLQMMGLHLPGLF